MKKILENANYKLQDGVRTCASINVVDPRFESGNLL